MTTQERIERIEKTLDLVFDNPNNDVLNQLYSAFLFWHKSKQEVEGESNGN